MDYINWQKEHSYKELHARLKREDKIRVLEETTAVNKKVLVFPSQERIRNQFAFYIYTNDIVSGRQEEVI